MAGSAINKSKSRSSNKERQSRSRSVSVVAEIKPETSRRTIERSVSPYLSTSLIHPTSLQTRWSDTPISDLFDEHTNGSQSTIPSAKSLTTISERIENAILEAFKLREERSHELMAEVSGRQKERTERDHQRNLEKARREDEKKHMLKKNLSPKKRDRDEVRPPVVGSHGLARQDGKESTRTRGDPLHIPDLMTASWPYL